MFGTRYFLLYNLLKLPIPLNFSPEKLFIVCNYARPDSVSQGQLLSFSYY